MFDLSMADKRHELRGRMNAEGKCPVIIMREANTSEWTVWRKQEAKREAMWAANHRARLAASGLSEAEYLQAREQVLAYSAAAQDKADALLALEQRREAGEDITEAREDLERETTFEQQALAVWGEAVNKLAAYKAPLTDEIVDTLDTTRHSFELVLACIVRIEGVTSGGKPVVWDDRALSDLGTTKSAVLESLLGPGQVAMHELYALVTLAISGLTPEQKKA